MRLTVAHNGDLELVPRLSEFWSVESVFGKMTTDLVGGGRNSYALGELDIKQLKRCVKQAHDYKLQYIYLLNASCLSNMETTRAFNNQLVAFIATLSDMGVDGFVTAMPYMLDLIKRHFPSKKVTVSTFAIINSIPKAKMWEARGADRIIVMQDSNRDFSLLTNIRRSVSCEIELFANNLCVNQCPFPPFHAAFNAHGSATGHASKGFALDYYSYNCMLKRLQNPVEFIRGRFIRPEDLHRYEDVGIDVFKLADRVKPTEWIVNTARAYHQRRYDGNMVDLIGYPYLRGDDDAVLGEPVKWMLRPEFAHPDMLKELREIGASKNIVYIDNRKLDGFLDHFVKHDCRSKICDEDCHHCQSYAKKAVRIDEAAAAERIAHLAKAAEKMVDRSAFASVPLPARIGIQAARSGASLVRFGKKLVS